MCAPTMWMAMRRLVGIAAILMVLTFMSGCGTIAMQQCRTQMMRSRDAYDRCLKANPDNPNKCESFRRTYDADLQAYEATRPHGISVQVDKH